VGIDGDADGPSHRVAVLLDQISQIAARPASFSMPFSATLLFDPTLTYSFAPSGDAMTFFVQW
jgi:hypothetical protein